MRSETPFGQFGCRAAVCHSGDASRTPMIRILDAAGFHADCLVEHPHGGSGGVLGVSLPGEDGSEGGEPVDAAPGVAVRGDVDGLLGLGAGCGQVAEGPQRIRVLRLDQSGLHIAGLGGSWSWRIRSAACSARVIDAWQPFRPPIRAYALA